MEPLKYENRFRKELKEREISPSEESWGKLKRKLDVEERRSVKPWWPTGIAASLAAGILMVVFNFSGEDTGVDPQIVDSPTEEVIREEVRREAPIKENITQEDKSVSAIADHIIAERDEPVPKQKQPAMSIASQNNKKAFVERGVRPDQKSILQTQDAGAPEDSSAIAISTPLEVNQGVTDAEIDALLYNATLQLSAERSEEIVRQIDAGDLLRDVESELEQSFRKKVLEVLQQGFSKAKNAVANRNL